VKKLSFKHEISLEVNNFPSGSISPEIYLELCQLPNESTCPKLYNDYYGELKPSHSDVYRCIDSRLSNHIFDTDIQLKLLNKCSIYTAEVF